MKNFALGHAFIVRFTAIRKWPIIARVFSIFSRGEGGLTYLKTEVHFILDERQKVKDVWELCLLGYTLTASPAMFPLGYALNKGGPPASYESKIREVTSYHKPS